MSIRRSFVIAVAAATGPLVGGASAAAGDHPLPVRPCAQEPGELPATPRIQRIQVDGQRVLVVVPTRYDEGLRRYPALYFLHGALSTPESTIRGLDLVEFTASEDVIVVVPAASELGAWADWRSDKDGSSQWETFLLRRVVPAVDRSFRTYPRRSQRAIAGLSMGGFGSLAHAARAPDLFVAAGAFSGMIDFGRSLGVTAITPASPVLHACFEGRIASGYDIYGGTPATESVWYADGNAVDKPRNLAGVRTWFAIGDGTPCDAEDAAVVAGDPGDPLWEPDFKRINDELDRALTRAGVDHVYDAYGCGVHTYRHFRRALASFWPVMLDAFGTPAPNRFDYRTARQEFSVYGWDVRADPGRAPEFLELIGAGAEGLALRGSGATSVRTPPRFRPRQRIRVNGAADAPLVRAADAAGRLSFEVDLGAPHGVQEGRPGAARDRIRRQISFSPPMRRASRRL